MEGVFWTIVVYVFVVGTLATVAAAFARMFGLGQSHRPQH